MIHGISGDCTGTSGIQDGKLSILIRVRSSPASKWFLREGDPVHKVLISMNEGGAQRNGRFKIIDRFRDVLHSIDIVTLW